MNYGELGYRAKACKSFRWMVGMRIANGWSGPRGTVLEGGDDYVIWYGEGSTRDGGGYQEACPPHGDLIPDLTDPATRGCMLALVREAWGDDRIHLCDPGDESPQWAVRGAWGLGFGETEAEALVEALESAP